MKKILIADSDYSNLKLLGKYFSEKSFTVLIAITTEQAIKIAEAKLPDIVLTVLGTSKINGLEIHKTLKSKKQTRNIPTLFVSDKKNKKQLELVCSEGGADYLLNPYPPEDLLNKAIQLTANKNNSSLTNGNFLIMVVDDIEVNRNLIEDFFDNSKFKILKSSGGKDSIKKIKENKIDLILLDIEMPEMNGWQTIERYKKMKLNIPVVALSAHSDEDFKKKCTQLGFAGVLSKPINRGKLNNIITTILKQVSSTKSEILFLAPVKTKNTSYINISKLLDVSKNDAKLRIDTHKKFIESINKLQKLLSDKKNVTETIGSLRREIHTFVNLSIYFCKNEVVKKSKEMEFHLKNNAENFNKNKVGFLEILNSIKDQLKQIKFEM
jgi:CheY-like chemotaxis protein